MIPRKCAAALALAMAVGAAAGCRDDPPHYRIDLDGEHRFRTGDDPGFAAPDLDDTGWDTVTLPATWQVWTTDADVIGWHRIRFEVTDLPASTRLALDLGVIGWSDEVFLNGRRIGATGWFDRVPRLNQWPRLYAVPDGALHPGSNLLAIRVRGIPLLPNGLFATRIGIGDELDLARSRANTLSRTMVGEGVLLGFLGFGWLLVALFPKRGRTGRATLFLLASLTLQLVQLWLVSATGRDTGWSPAVGAQVPFAVVTLAICASWAFMATLARGTLSPPVTGMIAAEAGVALIMLLWVDAMAMLTVVATVIGVIGSVVMCWLLVVAARARTPGAIPIAVGNGLSAVAVLGAFLVPEPFLVQVVLTYYGVPFAIACVLFALTRHVRAMDLQTQRAMEYALEAHTRERNRLARDLHDGLGQMLALLKLQMQRMGRKHQGEPVQRSFDDGAQQVTATLDELRRIARDLRPAPLQDRGFGEAVREYAAAMAQRTDLEVEVDGDYQLPPSEEVGDELYRIAQECLTNCLKHSGARGVVVTLAEVGDRYSLIVADDGRGLSAELPTGLGLATIRERSELLGGSCTITSAPGGGMRVEVSVPQ